MNNIDHWALLSAVLFAIILAHMIRLRRSGRAPAHDAYRRGLNPVHTHGVPSHE